MHERRRITAETALRLARYFKTNAEVWLNLQNFYDLEVTRRSGKDAEIDPPLIVNPYRMLSLPLSAQRFQLVSRWRRQDAEFRRGVQLQ